jgi:hypothetical protein
MKTFNPCVVSRKHVFPCVRTGKQLYLYLKDEGGRRDGNNYHIVVARGQKWDEIGQISQTTRFEHSVIALHDLLDAYYEADNVVCSITVLAKHDCGVLLMEEEIDG